MINNKFNKINYHKLRKNKSKIIKMILVNKIKKLKMTKINCKLL